jgi:hypothetical protein
VHGSYLERCHLVCPPREQAFYWLKEMSIETAVIVNDLPFLTYFLWITSLILLVLAVAIADMCHHTQCYEQVDEGSVESKHFLSDSEGNHILVWPFSPLVPRLSTDMTCDNSTVLKLRRLKSISVCILGVFFFNFI